MRETETGNILLEEIASLSSRGESGRLQITAGTTRGAFLFKQGKLVDARMGPFTGLAAVNLAVSIGRTQLSFDSSIQPPLSSFKEPEGSLLRSRFGIDVFDAKETGHQPETVKLGALLPEATPSGSRLETTSMGKVPGIPNKDAAEAIKEWDQAAVKEFPAYLETSRFSTPSQAVPSIMKPQSSETSAVVSRPFLLRAKRSLRRNPGEEFVLSACVVFLVAIVGAVGAHSYWKNGKQTQPLEARRPAKAEGSLTPPARHEAGKSIPTAKAVRIERQPSLNSAEARIKIENAKAGSEVPNRIIQSSTNAVSEDQKIVVEPIDTPSSRTIEVVVQIEDGHVTEAYVPNPQRGLRAYEATALRMARERRYPRDTRGRQSLILKVTGR